MTRRAREGEAFRTSDFINRFNVFNDTTRAGGRSGEEAAGNCTKCAEMRT